MKHNVLLWIVGVFGFLAAANAQTSSSSTAGTRFDGTYAFVSSTRLNETYTTTQMRIGQCPERTAGQLTIVNGQARYSGSGLYRTAEFEGTVGSQCELAMRSLTAMNQGFNEIITHGTIDGTGTATARQSGYLCNYDFVWQKVPK